MEKDYFLDRPKDVTMIDKIKVGTQAYICIKAMQDIATELDHLQKGVVTKVLTKKNHPRGIKVEICMENGTNMVGRCIYIIKDNLILTKDGLKEEKDVNK